MPEEKRLIDMYGGILAVPFLWLYSSSASSGFVLRNVAVPSRSGPVPGWLFVIGLFFARKKEDYGLAAMRGIGDENGIVIITAWLFAGVFGQLMAAAGGLVDGLLWMGMSTGAQGIFCGPRLLLPCCSPWGQAPPPVPASP